ncbi:MAG: type II toxin-antitoxin system CcdA family antitoxin [Rhodocyclaceae bacterium]|nr:type II toxin-antitoxin system CcdA family antitoxin [Rhodocyclaceae bacterium]
MNQTITSARKATNITLSADVLAEAKALGINISKSCDDFLRSLVARERASRWRTDHAEFIDAYNKVVTEEGLPLEQWRNF